MSRQKGFAIEEKARKFLEAKGLRHIASNFQSRFGEIDLIMSEKDTLIFVEVRARSSGKFGNAVETISFIKKQKLIKTAIFYLTIHKLHGKLPLRFDVITADGTSPQLLWIKDAFGIDY
ncbi:putative endonuclease distantly related to archaeal Holliday junction resolvase (plasmid) [Legionella adelaidensis]|uniref:UPF0102 protein Lade_2146 n=1 Tax=Legionella adelaidensis TaxID=45056 RepID=A0A0W0R178_9GAMM|nr:YraN family protein [Legionella adelaidensis]KTC64852.1 hypothetical protein Lade_2146 [Legionella adelaidensis]VEH82977.1 putative endonuclease distantly related to archaeal Holliday junction resolvase [Legionella adelaidensis]